MWKCLPWPGTSLWHRRQTPGSDKFQLQGSAFAAGRSMSRFVQNKLTSLVPVSASAPPIHHFKVGGDAPTKREPWRTGTSKNGLWENAAGWAPAWAMAQLQFLFFSAGCSQLMFVSIWIDRFICYDLLIGVLYGTAQEANIQTPPKIDIICERGVGWEGKHKCKIHQNSNIISRHLSSFTVEWIESGKAQFLLGSISCSALG